MVRKIFKKIIVTVHLNATRKKKRENSLFSTISLRDMPPILSSKLQIQVQWSLLQKKNNFVPLLGWPQTQNLLQKRKELHPTDNLNIAFNFKNFKNFPCVGGKFPVKKCIFNIFCQIPHVFLPRNIQIQFSLCCGIVPPKSFPLY